MTISTYAHNIETPEGAMRIYEARPSAAPKGGAIVVMEAFGVNDHIEDVARRTAALGYHAIAPDFFHRTGGGYAGYDEFPKIMEFFKGVSDDGILVDIDATLAHFKTNGINAKNVAIFGFCFGGRVAFLAGARRELGAAITYYGGGIVASRGPLSFPSLIDDVPTMKTPWMGHFGDKDQGIPVEDVEALRDALAKSAPVPFELHRYADADHGFHCEGRPNVFHAEVAAQAWSRTTDFIARHIA